MDSTNTVEEVRNDSESVCVDEETQPSSENKEAEPATEPIVIPVDETLNSDEATIESMDDSSEELNKEEDTNIVEDKSEDDSVDDDAVDVIDDCDTDEGKELETAMEETDESREVGAAAPVAPPSGVFTFSEQMDYPNEDESAASSSGTAKATRVAAQAVAAASRDARIQGLVRTRDILESLPFMDQLRAGAGPSNRSVQSSGAALTTGGGGSSVASVSGADKSEAGDAAGSDRDSVASGMVTRNLRRKDRRTASSIAANSRTNGKNQSSTTTTGKKMTSTRSNKGRGRRSVAKRKPVKSVSATPTPITSNRIYVKGEYFEVGDIVSVTDSDSGDIFYGQLRGFLTDEYGEKSGVMSWLLPTTASPPPNEGFHPATYIRGPDEDIARSMDVYTFVMHAPTAYFLHRNSPYRTLHDDRAGTGTKGSGFKAVRLGPRVIETVDNKKVYVGIYS